MRHVLCFQQAGADGRRCRIGNLAGVGFLGWGLVRGDRMQCPLSRTVQSPLHNSTGQVEFSILEASFLCPRTWEVVAVG